MHRTALLMSLSASALCLAANTGSGSGSSQRTPPASGATDPGSTQDATPVTPPHAAQPQVGESQLSDIATAPTPTGPADVVEDARPLASDWTAKLTQILNEATAELRSIATDNGDQDTTIRLNALADKIDHQAASAQAPTEHDPVQTA